MSTVYYISQNPIAENTKAIISLTCNAGVTDIMYTVSALDTYDIVTLTPIVQVGYQWSGWSGDRISKAKTITINAVHNAEINIAANAILRLNTPLKAINATKKFTYSGTVEQLNLLAGRYKIECYGARGGGKKSGSATGGYGGYSYGTLETLKECTIYACAGYRGTVNAAYNGGGKGADSNNGFRHGGGGGATHVSITNRGELKNFVNNKSEVLLVAGGGGGYTSGTSAQGGGLSGGANHSGNVANQTSGYAFGQGQGGGYYEAGGGGGWYGGYQGVGNWATAGGGSGYINPVLTNANTVLGGNTSTVDGYVVVTCLNINRIQLDDSDIGIESISVSPETYTIGDTVTITPVLKPGYEWGFWSDSITSTDKELVVTITDEELIYLKANTRPGIVTYEARHYQQNIGGTEYMLFETETLSATTDSTITPLTKTYTGFTSPDTQELFIKNDSTSLIEYYYTRNIYNVTVTDGTSDKTEYYYEEQGLLSYKPIDALLLFRNWCADVDVRIKNAFKRSTSFVMPPYDVNFFVAFDGNRTNSNIYKNIFKEEIVNVDYLNNALLEMRISTEDVRQENHGLSPYDAVYLDEDGLYKKALAEDSNKANVVGIVSKVASANIFTLMDQGQIPYKEMDLDDTSILYLSDTIPGQLVHYNSINNTVFVPVAIYTNSSIIINIQQGSIGDTLAPYGEEVEFFETYTEDELNDTINNFISGVIT